MFERFTTRARRAVVAAQEEARALGHNYIGTEHVLLGLLQVPDGVAGRALDRFELTLGGVREEVTARVGAGAEAMKGHIPFTPRAKKVLEFALREALELHHNYIGTEHMLLGLIKEKDGVGPEILAGHADLLAIRMAVLDLLPTAQAAPGHRWVRRRPATASSDSEVDEVRTSPAADASLEEAARLAGAGPIGSHHLLLATLADPDTAAAKALTGLGVDLDQAREALLGADVTGTSDEQPEERGRRHMLIRTTGNSLTIEATDQALVGLGRAAAEAVGGQPGTIRGDLPASVSLAAVWQALRASLEDIRRRATAAKDTAAKDDEAAPPAAEGGAETR